jgi:hypothetical protein
MFSRGRRLGRNGGYANLTDAAWLGAWQGAVTSGTSSDDQAGGGSGIIPPEPLRRLK